MILVMGATGKVGRHLVAGLLAEGAPVRALTRDPETADLPAGAEVVRGDPGRPETIAAALAGTTAVFVNVTAVGGFITELMAEAAQAGTRTAVLLSSLAVRDNGVQPYSIGAHHKAPGTGPASADRSGNARARLPGGTLTGRGGAASRSCLAAVET